MPEPAVSELNPHKAATILSSDADVQAAGYTYVRSNDAAGQIFKNWIHQAFSERAEKVLSQIHQGHGGKLSDSRFETRMRGKKELVAGFHRFFHLLRQRHCKGRSKSSYISVKFGIREMDSCPYLPETSED